MEVPFKHSVKYPCQLNTKVKTETLKLYRSLKEMGVDVGEIQRRALEDAAQKALKALDKRAG
jgi:hypothetical protein